MTDLHALNGAKIVRYWVGNYMSELDRNGMAAEIECAITAERQRADALEVSLADTRRVLAEEMESAKNGWDEVESYRRDLKAAEAALATASKDRKKIDSFVRAMNGTGLVVFTEYDNPVSALDRLIATARAAALEEAANVADLVASHENGSEGNSKWSDDIARRIRALAASPTIAGSGTVSSSSVPLDRGNTTALADTSTIQETTMNDAMTFNNGLSPEHDNEIDDITIELSRLALRIEDLGRHRSYSTAITKIDEARHWLRDRKHRAA